MGFPSGHAVAVELDDEDDSLEGPPVDLDEWARTRRPRRLGVGMGLCLDGTVGTPRWRLRYRFGDLPRTYTIGPWPEVSMEQARQAALTARDLLRQGVDPVEHRRGKLPRRERQPVPLRKVIRVWLETRRSGMAPVSFDTMAETLARYVTPALGHVDVAALTTPQVAKMAREVALRSHETARRVLGWLVHVVDFALASGWRSEPNPVAAARAVLPRGKQAGRHPALTEWHELGKVLRSARAARLSPSLHAAHRLLAYTGVRLGTVLGARWNEFALEGDAPTWTIPRGRMKAKDARRGDFALPLAPSVAEELRQWARVSAARPDGLTFPGAAHPDAPLVLEAMSKAYRETLGLGDSHVPHGWRAAFSTRAREAGWPRDVVELALDHAGGGSVERAYDRGGRLDARRELFAWWARGLAAAERGEDFIERAP